METEEHNRHQTTERQTLPKLPLQSTRNRTDTLGNTLIHILAKSKMRLVQLLSLSKYEAGVSLALEILLLLSH